jgi:hypothetical protein
LFRARLDSRFRHHQAAAKAHGKNCECSSHSDEKSTRIRCHSLSLSVRRTERANLKRCSELEKIGEDELLDARLCAGWQQSLMDAGAIGDDASCDVAVIGS